MDMYYYVFMTNLVSKATWQPCILVNFVKKYKKSEKNTNPYSLSTILITDRQIWYVCVGLQLLSAKLPFYLIFH